MTWQKMVAESVPAKPAPAGAGTRPKQGKPRGSNGSARQGDTQAIDGLAKELNVRWQLAQAENGQCQEVKNAVIAVLLLNSPDGALFFFQYHRFFLIFQCFVALPRQSGYRARLHAFAALMRRRVFCHLRGGLVCLKEGVWQSMPGLITSMH